MVTRIHSRGLLIQLLTLIVLPTLMALLWITYQGVTYHEHAMRALVDERDDRAVRAAAGALADRFTQRRLVLRVIANQIAEGTTLDRLLQDDASLHSVFDGGLVAVAKNGDVIASWQPGAIWQTSLRSAAVPWVLEHDQQAPVIIANERSFDGNVILFGGVSLDSINVPGTMGLMQNNPNTRLYLVADDGHILNDSAGIATGSDAMARPDLKIVLTALDHSTQTTGGNSDDAITVASRVSGLNWTLVIQEPWQFIENSALHSSLIAPLAAIPAVLLVLAILAFGLTRIVLPLRRLGMSAIRLSWGDYETIQQPVGGVQEIRDLQATLSHMGERLQQAQAGMRSYIGAMLQGQEDERKHLAREIHDDALQSLIALDQQRQMAQRALEHDPAKVALHLDQFHEMLTALIQNMRRLIRDMRPSYIEDLGLMPALEMLCSQQNEKASVQVSFSAKGIPQRLLANQELSLYRIAQEALNNAIQHAHSSQIDMTLCFDKHILLTIRDNGQGFDLPERPGVFAQAGHYGLMGMVERAEQLGATLKLDSTPGKGTTIEIRVVDRQ